MEQKMQKHIILGTSLTLLAALITGCNSNDDDDNAALTQVPSTTQVTITPSLGKILNAKVVLRNANTGLEIGSGNTGNSGIATFNVTKTTAPVVVEVQGSATAKYVDESKLSATNTGEVNFDAAQKIRATVPTLATNIGVSTLTEVAYQAALKKASNNEKAISADIATKANEAVRKALAPELTSITAAPTVIGSVADLAAIQNTEAGKYALKLTALAKLVPNTNAAPAIAALKQLAADIISDDKLDGLAPDYDIAFDYTNANLVNKILANINVTIGDANLSGFTASQFTPVLGNIVITVGGTGGGTGSGQNCALNANYNIAGQAISYQICYTNFPQNAVCSNANTVFSEQSIPGYAGTVSWQFNQVATCPAGSIQVNYVN